MYRLLQYTGKLELSYCFSGLRMHKIVLKLIKYWKFQYELELFLIDPFTSNI